MTTRLAFVILGLALAGGFVLADTGDAAEPPSVQARALPVETLSVQAVSSYTITRAYTGRLEARKAAEARLRTCPVPHPGPRPSGR